MTIYFEKSFLNIIKKFLFVKLLNNDVHKCNYLVLTYLCHLTKACLVLSQLMLV